MRTALRVPWDVPVRLVGQAGAPQGDPTARDVTVGWDLPGVRTLRVTTVPVRGVTHLARIEPGASDRRETSDGDLAGLLETLADPDGAVPILVDGTPFTHAVLDALVHVPCGERITYAGLATLAGRPRAVRAVATVMARNRVPLVVPCHRVVPSSGGTGRYGWGDPVKVALLDAEAGR